MFDEIGYELHYAKKGFSQDPSYIKIRQFLYFRKIFRQAKNSVKSFLICDFLGVK